MMRALVYEQLGATPEVQQVPEPEVPASGVVLRVGATGVCRSDWHAWVGHDPDIVLPHVPGHEFAGTVVGVGERVENWAVGDRVTTPFLLACGSCTHCRRGVQNLCDRSSQPGFASWGSFAELVAVPFADVNLVRLPEQMEFATAASLGCRFVTSFRAVVDRARTSAGEWVAVHGCGGVGLSAVMIARALGARVVAIDIHADKLALAVAAGADAVVDASTEDVVTAVRDLTGGGAHVSIEALGHRDVFLNSVRGLRKQGRHVQVGLMMGDSEPASLHTDEVLFNELEVLGSFGMPSHRYDAMLAMIDAGLLQPEKLIGRTLGLAEAGEALMTVGTSTVPGVSVVVDP
ncbi:alcohol dehydrogenase [Nocardioides zeae]|uniref:Alcohol dehydrogenase n=1 Tax=Nocardioides zeae TaxID=1457234 RepID=A0ACC6IE79_9ACTN|nr:zinc-dependent alcohol dehydrogenase family protein [Nocardioides zeae]MDR6174177.1 alcohol dehydrogenase [Nocardioides zeae]MDR6208984.1 alcohol dehydrogenase [Nocardioides zeae]